MSKKVEKDLNKPNLVLIKELEEKFTLEEKFFIKEAIISVLSEIIYERQNNDINDTIIDYYKPKDDINYQYYNYLWKKRRALNKLYEIFNR